MKFIILCTKFKNNYISCIGRNNENICNSRGGTQEKRKKKNDLQLTTKNWCVF